MLKFVRNISLIILVAFIVSNAISYFSLWSLRQSQFYKPAFLVNANKSKSYDYVILGASTGLTTLDTQVIDDNLQTTGINLSVDDTGISSNYLMLQHFLAEGNKTKVCVLAPSVKGYSLSGNRHIQNDYRFLMFINRDYVYDYYHHFSGFQANILKFSKWFPALGVSYYNAELLYPSLISSIKPEKHNRFDDNGNYTYPVFKGEDHVIENFNPLTIQFSNSYLKKIKNLCEKNDIQLICYITPVKGKLIDVDRNDYNIINHSALLKNSKYFYDNIHVNAIGRLKVSRAFANELKECLGNN